MFPHRGLWLAPLASVILVIGVARGDPKPGREADRVARLIRQLGHDEFARREAASADLEAIGEPAREALRTATTSSDDVEIRRRAEGVLRTLTGRAMEREQKKLDGAWSLVSYEVDGKQIKGEDKAHVFGFKSGRWSMTVGGSQFQGGTITLIEPAGKLNTIDLLISEGGNPGATAYSIYAIDGDTLRYLNCGLPRPSQFVTKPGDGRHYLTFRRVKGGGNIDPDPPEPRRSTGVGIPPGGP